MAKKEDELATIARTMKQARTRIGWSQTELADALGMKVSQVSRYENEKSMPSPKVLKRIADVLGRAWTFI